VIDEIFVDEFAPRRCDDPNCNGTMHYDSMFFRHICDVCDRGAPNEQEAKALRNEHFMRQLSVTVMAYRLARDESRPVAAAAVAEWISEHWGWIEINS
jgi:hypothetical protein